MTFSERLNIIKDYERWLKSVNDKNMFTISDCLETFLGYLEIQELLNDRATGEWIADKNRTYSENEDTWECSVCHEPFTLIEGTPEDNLYYYCPKCGARLIADGGEK